MRSHLEFSFLGSVTEGESSVELRRIKSDHLHRHLQKLTREEGATLRGAATVINYNLEDSQ